MSKPGPASKKRKPETTCSIESSESETDRVQTDLIPQTGNIDTSLNAEKITTCQDFFLENEATVPSTCQKENTTSTTLPLHDTISESDSNICLNNKEALDSVSNEKKGLKTEVGSHKEELDNVYKETQPIKQKPGPASWKNKQTLLQKEDDSQIISKDLLSTDPEAEILISTAEDSQDSILDSLAQYELPDSSKESDNSPKKNKQPPWPNKDNSETVISTPQGNQIEPDLQKDTPDPVSKEDILDVASNKDDLMDNDLPRTSYNNDELVAKDKPQDSISQEAQRRSISETDEMTTSDKTYVSQPTSADVPASISNEDPLRNDSEMDERIAETPKDILLPISEKNEENSSTHPEGKETCVFQEDISNVNSMDDRIAQSEENETCDFQEGISNFNSMKDNIELVIPEPPIFDPPDNVTNTDNHQKDTPDPISTEDQMEIEVSQEVITENEPQQNQVHSLSNCNQSYPEDNPDNIFQDDDASSSDDNLVIAMSQEEPFEPSSHIDEQSFAKNDQSVPTSQKDDIDIALQKDESISPNSKLVIDIEMSQEAQLTSTSHNDESSLLKEYQSGPVLQLTDGYHEDDDGSSSDEKLVIAVSQEDQLQPEQKKKPDSMSQRDHPRSTPAKEKKSQRKKETKPTTKLYCNYYFIHKVLMQEPLLTILRDSDFDFNKDQINDLWCIYKTLRPWSPQIVKTAFKELHHKYWAKLRSLSGAQRRCGEVDMTRQPVWLKLCEARLNMLPILLRRQEAAEAAGLDIHLRLAKAAAAALRLFFIRPQGANGASKSEIDASNSSIDASQGESGSNSGNVVSKSENEGFKTDSEAFGAVGVDYKLWCHLRNLAVQKLQLLLRAGDRTNALPRAARMTAADWLAVDAAILYDCPFDIVHEDSLTMFEQLQALTMTFHLVRAFHLEDRGTAQDWTNALHAYTTRSTRGTMTSVVVLQRRWYELKAQARVRVTALGGHCACKPRNRAKRDHKDQRDHKDKDILALTDKDNKEQEQEERDIEDDSRPRPHPIHWNIARTFPQVVTSPTFPTWAELVRAGNIHAHPVEEMSPDEEWQRESYNALAIAMQSDEIENEDKEDDDIILIERDIETIDLVDDEPHTPGEVGNQMSGDAGNQISVEVENQTPGEVGNQMSGEVGNQMVGKVGNQISVEVGNQMSVEIGNQTPREVGVQLYEEVGNQVVGEIENQKVGEVENQTSRKVGNRMSWEMGNQTPGEMRKQTPGEVGIQASGEVGNQTNVVVGNHMSEDLGNAGAGVMHSDFRDVDVRPSGDYPPWILNHNNHEKNLQNATSGVSQEESRTTVVVPCGYSAPPPWSLKHQNEVGREVMGNISGDIGDAEPCSLDINTSGDDQVIQETASEEPMAGDSMSLSFLASINPENADAAIIFSDDDDEDGNDACVDGSDDIVNSSVIRSTVIVENRTVINSVKTENNMISDGVTETNIASFSTLQNRRVSDSNDLSVSNDMVNSQNDKVSSTKDVVNSKLELVKVSSDKEVSRTVMSDKNDQNLTKSTTDERDNAEENIVSKDAEINNVISVKSSSMLEIVPLSLAQRETNEREREGNTTDDLEEPESDSTKIKKVISVKGRSLLEIGPLTLAEEGRNGSEREENNEEETDSAQIESDKTQFNSIIVKGRNIFEKASPLGLAKERTDVTHLKEEKNKEYISPLLDYKLRCRAEVRLTRCDRLPFWRRHSRHGVVNVKCMTGVKCVSSGKSERPRFTYSPAKLLRNPDFDIRLKGLSSSFLRRRRNLQLLEMCVPLTVDIVPLPPGGRAGDAATGGRRAKRIELPDIEHVRRANRGPLVAQVAPTPQQSHHSHTETKDNSSQSPVSAVLGPGQAGRIEQEVARCEPITSDQLSCLLKRFNPCNAKSLGPVRKYCCMARRHRAINTARRRLASKRPTNAIFQDRNIHFHPAGERCRCCCAHLLSEGSVWRQLEQAHLTLARELASAHMSDSVSSEAADVKTAIDGGAVLTNHDLTDDVERRNENEMRRVKRSVKAKQRRKRKKRKSEEIEPQVEEKRPRNDYEEWERQKSVNQKYFRIYHGPRSTVQDKKDDAHGTRPTAADNRQAVTDVNESNQNKVCSSSNNQTPNPGYQLISNCETGSVGLVPKKNKINHVLVSSVNQSNIVRLLRKESDPKQPQEAVKRDIIDVEGSSDGPSAKRVANKQNENVIVKVKKSPNNTDLILESVILERTCKKNQSGDTSDNKVFRIDSVDKKSNVIKNVDKKIIHVYDSDTDNVNEGRSDLEEIEKSCQKAEQNEGNKEIKVKTLKDRLHFSPEPVISTTDDCITTAAPKIATPKKFVTKIIQGHDKKQMKVLTPSELNSTIVDRAVEDTMITTNANTVNKNTEESLQSNVLPLTRDNLERHTKMYKDESFKKKSEAPIKSEGPNYLSAVVSLDSQIDATRQVNSKDSTVQICSAPVAATPQPVINSPMIIDTQPYLRLINNASSTMTLQNYQLPSFSLVSNTGVASQITLVPVNKDGASVTPNITVIPSNTSAVSPMTMPLLSGVSSQGVSMPLITNVITTSAPTNVPLMTNVVNSTASTEVFQSGSVIESSTLPKISNVHSLAKDNGTPGPVITNVSSLAPQMGNTNTAHYQIGNAGSANAVQYVAVMRTPEGNYTWVPAPNVARIAPKPPANQVDNANVAENTAKVKSNSQTRAKEIKLVRTVVQSDITKDEKLRQSATGIAYFEPCGEPGDARTWMMVSGSRGLLARKWSAGPGQPLLCVDGTRDVMVIANHLLLTNAKLPVKRATLWSISKRPWRDCERVADPASFGAGPDRRALCRIYTDKGNVILPVMTAVWSMSVALDVVNTDHKLWLWRRNGQLTPLRAPQAPPTAYSLYCLPNSTAKKALDILKRELRTRAMTTVKRNIPADRLSDVNAVADRSGTIADTNRTETYAVAGASGKNNDHPTSDTLRSDLNVKTFPPWLRNSRFLLTPPSSTVTVSSSTATSNITATANITATSNITATANITATVTNRNITTSSSTDIQSGSKMPMVIAHYVPVSSRTSSLPLKWCTKETKGYSKEATEHSDESKEVTEESKNRSGGLKVSSEKPKVSSKAPKLLPKEPKLLPKEPKLLPKEPKLLPKEPKLLPKEPKLLPKEPKLLPKESKVGTKESKVTLKLADKGTFEVFLEDSDSTNSSDIVMTEVKNEVISLDDSD